MSKTTTIAMAAIALAAAVWGAGCADKGQNPAIVETGTNPPAIETPFDVTPQQAARQMQADPDAFLMDVRSLAEYDPSHVTDSVLIPLPVLADHIADNTIYPEINRGRTPRKDQRILVICRSGNRSSTAVRQLRQMGYARSSSISGGIGAWNSAGLPITTSVD